MAAAGLAGILRHSNPSAAVDAYEHMLRHLEEIPANAAIQRTQGEMLAGAADPLRRLGRSAEARHHLDRAFLILSGLKLYPATKVVPGSVAFKALCARAAFKGATGDPVGALEDYRTSLTAIRAAGLDPNSLLEDAVD